MAKFYITNSIPYVNARPHLGHALEFTQSDTINRYHRMIGDGVLFLCGSDDNAIKNVQAAEATGIPVKDFVKKNSKLFEGLAKKLNVRFDVFQHGASVQHHRSSEKLWELCAASGDIYKKEYKGLYCVGCELFYETDELNEKGECFEHPGKKLEEVSETNYFFKLSKYENQLKKLIEQGELEIIPGIRKNEALAFIKQGLQDISISRSNKRAKNWGVQVPGDPTQKMYVWFDALNIYQSGVGFALDSKKYKKWWPANLHVIGKGIVRFHAVYWPAFLMSAGLVPPKGLFVHGYLTVNGQKMSKTLGNVVDPVEIIEKYGTDSLRYYLLREIPAYGDGDFRETRLKEVYNADLANGIGNLVSRVAKLCESADFVSMGSKSRVSGHLIEVGEYSEALSEYRFNDALGFVWKKIKELDHFIDQEKPWELLKGERGKGIGLSDVLAHAVDGLQEISALLAPFLPETAKKIEDQFKGPKILSQKPLFPRL